ncbi:MAG: hypothetical protein HOH19_12660 [Kordiimonadaceae bacterium]|jgi:hypothetical protein|nr:hypothetical protein [Kordiimonadaceae bacterium]MBT6033419.1 hypothetical protein [Kordiimonadaceae bacterium]
MENKSKSKYIVLGMVAFVLAIYSGSYFYTKDNNQRLLSSPMLVMLVGDELTVNAMFVALSSEERRDRMLSMYEMGNVFSISQKQYDDGATDIEELYKDRIFDNEFAVANCYDYSEILRLTKAKVAKTTLRASWIFSACGIIE